MKPKIKKPAVADKALAAKEPSSLDTEAEALRKKFAAESAANPSDAGDMMFARPGCEDKED